jgi:4-hydroxy-2-oxoheptanedioate aldolase
VTTLREQWAAGEPTFGAWLTVASTLTAEATARAGFDYVCIDNQHGGVDYEVTARMIQAVLLGGARPIVRVPWNEPGIVGKMLDAGAEGIVVPMVNTAEEAAAVVRAVRYPPLGARSFGPVFAGLRAPGYHVEANARVAAVPMIETADALARLDDILSVDGIDAIYVGPADLSLSLGLPPANNDDSAVFTDALEAIVAACRRHGVVPGIHATGALADRRREQGFVMITVASDVLAMRMALGAELAQARGTGAKTGDGRAIY